MINILFKKNKKDGLNANEKFRNKETHFIVKDAFLKIREQERRKNLKIFKDKNFKYLNYFL